MYAAATCASAICKSMIGASARRELVAHLRHFRLDLRQRRVGVVVELEVDGDVLMPCWLDDSR